MKELIKDTYADTWRFRRLDQKHLNMDLSKKQFDRIKRSPVKEVGANKGIDDADTMKKANTYLDIEIKKFL